MPGQNEYMDFAEIPASGKTKIIQILNKRSGFVLGYVQWYGAWRQYCFMPSPSSVFSFGCMSDINHKVAELNTEHRQELTERKKHATTT